MIGWNSLETLQRTPDTLEIVSGLTVSRARCILADFILFFNPPAREHLKRFAGATQKFRARWDDWKQRHSMGGRHSPRQEREDYMSGPNPYAHIRGTCNVQVLRSVSDWSHGILLERSIQNAYIQMIREANHFIYIGM